MFTIKPHKLLTTNDSLTPCCYRLFSSVIAYIYHKHNIKPDLQQFNFSHGALTYLKYCFVNVNVNRGFI